MSFVACVLLLIVMTIFSLYKVKKLVMMGFVLVVLSVMVSPVFANQAQSGLSNYVTIVGEDTASVREGAIVVYTNGEYRISASPYQFKLIGVVTQDPPVAIDYTSDRSGTPVAISGVNEVLVSTENGPIVEGDLLTTSSEVGVAMKAVEPGYVLGIALEDFNAEAGVIGTIPLALEVDYSYNPAFRARTAGETAQANFKDIFTLSSVAVYESPTKVFKYVMAALILLGTLVFAFLSFTRSAQNGIEAIGRNPLAKGQIQLGVVMNILLSLVIIVSGVVVSYFILML